MESKVSIGISPSMGPDTTSGIDAVLHRCKRPSPMAPALADLSRGFRQRVPRLTTRPHARSCARGQSLPGARAGSRRSPRLPRAATSGSHDRARAGSDPPRGVGRRQHARGRARRLERRARDRRGRAARCTSSPTSLDLPRADRSSACARCCSTSCRAISPDGAEARADDRPLRALGAARRARRARPAALDRSATSTATASRSRCASRIRAASSSRRASSPACSSSARSRTRARSTSCIPRA